MFYDSLGVFKMQLARALLIASALAFAPLGAASCQHLPDAAAVWESGSSTIPFQLFRGNRVIAAGAINGQRVDFLLDTGAGVTTVDRAFARKIGLPPGQKIKAQGAGGVTDAEIVTGVTLSIGKLRLENAPVVVVDLAAVTRSIGRPANVILGRELFDNAIVGLDWEGSKLTLVDPDEFAPPPSARLIELGKGNDRLNTIPISVAGLPPVKAHLDLGNGAVLSLPKSYWNAKPELRNLPYALSEAGGVGGLHSNRLVTLGEVSFAGTTFTDVPANLGENTNAHAVDEPNAGIGLLKPFKVTMDLGHNRLYLEPLSNPAPFQRDRAGVRTEYDGKDLNLVFVTPGSPAASAGLIKGERVVAIDGIAVGDRFYESAASDWNFRPAGEQIELELADGRTVTVTLADYY